MDQKEITPSIEDLFRRQVRRDSDVRNADLLVHSDRADIHVNLAEGTTGDTPAEPRQPIMMTAAAIVREKKKGTIEQILVTPIRSDELMLGKITPNIVIILGIMLLIIAMGIALFRVPFRGSFGSSFGWPLCTYSLSRAWGC